MIVRLSAATAMVALLASSLTAQRSTPAPLRLVRCERAASAACLQTRLVLGASGASAFRNVDSATETRDWVGALGGSALLGPGVKLSRQITPPLRLLVLLDLSGSMKGTSIAYVRTAIRSDLLHNLDSASARVAIAGFESHHVRAGIDSVTFLTPDAAITALARLGDPVPNGNTGLYTAIVAASERLRNELARTPGAEGAILLVTDGGNDVRGSGDPDLLDGESGLEQAAAAATGSDRQIWILGVGNSIAGDVLDRIAGRHFFKADVSPVEIGRQMESIVREFRGARELTFGVGGSDAAALGRAPWPGTAALVVADSAVVQRDLAWRPPFFALPAFDGVADSTAITPAMRDAILASSGSRTIHWLMLIAFTLLGVLFGTLAPRLAWIRSVDVDDEEPVAAPERRPVAAVVAAVAPVEQSAAGLRQDVVEVAPRRSGDITSQSATRRHS